MAYRGQTADEGEGLPGGNSHEAFLHVPHRQQSQVRMIFQQEIMGRITVNHRNRFVSQVRHAADVRHFLAREYDDREREVRVGEVHPLPPLGGGGYGREEIEFAVFNGPQHLLPRPRPAGFEFNTEQFTHSVQVIDSYAFHAEILVGELHRRPVHVKGNPKNRMVPEECVFL